jgi:phosphatidylserine/phosphatidylglycerophosphate/cardiolipin synthase-like enzyme
VERLTGLADLGTNVTFERTSELRQRGIRIVPPADIDPLPGRNAVRQLIEPRLPSGEWVRAVGQPQAELQYNCSVRVDVTNGRLERLRSAEWIRALTDSLRSRGFELSAPAPVEPGHSWVGLESRMIRSLWGARKHSSFLEQVLERSTSYIFIHSAFLTGKCASRLVAPITQAVRRGIDVLVARGGTEEASVADEEGVNVFKKLAYDERGSKGRFFFQSYPTGSHAKVLVRDGEEVCIGSFNWLSAPAESLRPELSLCIENAIFAAIVCDIAADLFREGGAMWPAQMLRTRIKASSSPMSEPVMEARLVMDAEHRDCLFSYLDSSRDRLLVYSDKVTSKEDPLLREKLIRTARELCSRHGLGVGFSSVDGDRASIIDGLADLGANVLGDGVNHMKALLSDDVRALVTSFNLLSFGGRSSRRSSGFEIGIELRVPASSDGLQKLLAGLYKWETRN